MIEIRHLSKSFTLKDSRVDAVRDVSLSIEEGEIFGVIGNSGAGKSTLVRCLNLLETPDEGEIVIEGRMLSFRDGSVFSGEDKKPTGEKEKAALRRSIGMIFQHFNLLDRSTVYDNIAYPLRYTGLKKEEIDARVRELLELVSLTDKIDAYPSQLSGGQKQRVAIARALANRPKILLSDEATSALDPDATESILRLLRDLNRRLGLTVVLITHEMAVIKAIAQRVAVMENGKVVETGDVYDIFTVPQEDITKRFIASASPLSKIDKLIAENSPTVHTGSGELLVRLSFRGKCAGEAAISKISRDEGVAVNLVLANMEELQGRSLGELIAVVSGGEKNIENALNYLKEINVKVEVLRRG